MRHLLLATTLALATSYGNAATAAADSFTIEYDAPLSADCDSRPWPASSGCLLRPAVGSAPGAQFGSFEFEMHWTEAMQSSSLFSLWSYETYSLPGSGLRISYSAVSIQVAAYDIATNALLWETGARSSLSYFSYPGRAIHPLYEAEAGDGLRVVVSWEYKPGVMLVPSLDPTCASLACMTPADLRLTELRVTAVPEPSTYALTAAGLAVVAAVARRRRATPVSA